MCIHQKNVEDECDKRNDQHGLKADYPTAKVNRFLFLVQAFFVSNSALIVRFIEKTRIGRDILLAKQTRNRDVEVFGNSFDIVDVQVTDFAFRISLKRGKRDVKRFGNRFDRFIIGFQ